jgi:hypothetical protein
LATAADPLNPVSSSTDQTNVTWLVNDLGSICFTASTRTALPTRSSMARTVRREPARRMTRLRTVTLCPTRRPSASAPALVVAPVKRSRSSIAGCATLLDA